MLSWIKQLVAKPVQPNVATPDHLKLSVLKRDIPRYPPFMKGLPLESPEDIIAVQSELMVQLAQSTKVTKAAFEEHYRSAILRFACFVHLLPASQAHHHRGAGGLLRHSIEVGLWALREADKMLLLELCKTPGHRREIEPRWLLTAFLAGLCHDIGKPATDVLVRNHASTKQWNPIECSLWEWADHEGIDAYFLEWQSGRAKHHVAITGALAKNIISDKTLAWISSESPQLFVWLMETLNGTPGNTNPLYEIVIKADQKSVERDLKSMGAVMAGYDLGVPVERTITDIMRRMIRQGIWSVNEPGAKVWNIDGCIYLVWPTSGQDIANQVNKDGIPGVPRNADSILDMLIERNLAFTDTEGLYRIAPAVLAAKIPDIKLSCIRLRDDTLVSADPIPPVEGKVLGAPQQADESTGSQGAPEPKTAQAGAQSSPALASGEVTKAVNQIAIPSATSEPDDKPAARSEPTKATKPTARATGQRSAPVIPNVTPAGSLKEVIDQETGEITTSETPKESRTVAGDAEQPSSKIPTAPPKRRDTKSAPTLVLDGAVGEALKALAEDLNAGRKAWGEHVVIEDDERVLLMWPDAFSGYGLTPSVIINDLSTKNWCWADPMIPTRKVIEVELNGAVLRAIRLHHEVSEAFLYVAGPSTHAGTHTPAATPSIQSAEPSAPVSLRSTHASTEASQAVPGAIHSTHKTSSQENQATAVHAEVRVAEKEPKPTKTEKAPPTPAQKPVATTAPDARPSKPKQSKPAHPAESVPTTPSKPQSKPTMNSVPVLADDQRVNMPTQAVQTPRANAAPTLQDVESRKLDLLLVTANRLATPSPDAGWKEVHVQVLLAELRIDTGMDYGRPYVFELAKSHPERFKLVKRALVYRDA